MEQRLRLAESVFEAANEGIFITDLSGTILDVNPSLLRITGFMREELIGQTPRIFKSGAHDQNFYGQLWRHLEMHNTWSGELINRRKNGDLHYTAIAITRVLDKKGCPLHYVAACSDISQAKQQEHELRLGARHDRLTGLPNHEVLTELNRQAVTSAITSSRILAVMLIDLDDFRPINETYGHAIGDRLLRKISQRLRSRLQAGDTVTRVGGDEFIVLLPDREEISDCESFARDLLDAISQPVEIDHLQLHLSASMGISLCPNNGDESDQLIRSARQAMYAAKRSGRNRIVFSDEQGRQRDTHPSELILDLQRAIDDKKIIPHFQPIVDLASGRVITAEALARWVHPERGAIPPSEFIPIAENHGLIQAMGDLIFSQAAIAAKKWNRLLPPKEDTPLRRIAVNRSPLQFCHHNHRGWQDCLSNHNVPGNLLSVEITEGLLLDDRPEIQAQLNDMRQAGMAISLDDFGTGYSALSYLKKFQIDTLKIDRSFIRDIVTEPKDRAIVESIVLMACRLGIKLIAEGVETKAQADVLAAAGCHFVQGYFYAPPMPEEDFLDFVFAAEARPLYAPLRKA
ncbi:MAG TPA: EAL domain-containing protein [Rhodocyclaceae bacterium]|nr:EAL domain-containing protein [Rhodocyclaceae bacterium]